MDLDFCPVFISELINSKSLIKIAYKYMWSVIRNSSTQLYKICNIYTYTQA